MKVNLTTKDGQARGKSRRAFLGSLSLALPAASLLLASACQRGGGQGDKFVIGFSQANKAEPWRTWMDSTLMKEAAKHPQLEIAYADAQQDNSKQVADVENFLRQRVDLLIISPNEAKPLTGIVKRVYDSGIPVIVLDRSIEGDSYTTFIGADNREIGRAAGEYAAQLLGGKGNVVEIKGLPGSTPAIDRNAGFREAVAAHPGIEIIADPVADWLRDKGREQAEAALRANEKIDLIYGHNDPMAMGAYLAATAMNRADGLKIIGIDGLPGTEGGAKAVLDGKLDATFLYPNCGTEAIETAMKILNKEQPPKKITPPTARITKENAAQFINE
ncbi:MAG: substrate-binding domain-containing protein [Pyrinomonadaceae bacterium]|nr:substrate-binding domain-containing protein [Pyrinomonadaceae bacterium]